MSNVSGAELCTPVDQEYLALEEELFDSKVLDQKCLKLGELEEKLLEFKYLAKSFFRFLNEQFYKDHDLGELGLVSFNNKVGPVVSDLSPELFEHALSSKLRDYKKELSAKAFEDCFKNTLNTVIDEAIYCTENVIKHPFKIILYKPDENKPKERMPIASYYFEAPDPEARGEKRMFSLLMILDNKPDIESLFELENLLEDLSNYYKPVLEKYVLRKNAFEAAEKDLLPNVDYDNSDHLRLLKTMSEVIFSD